MRSGPAAADACNDFGGFGQVVNVSAVRHSVGPRGSTVDALGESGSAAEFEVFYRKTVGVVAAFFARRCSEGAGRSDGTRATPPEQLELRGDGSDRNPVLSELLIEGGKVGKVA